MATGVHHPLYVGTTKVFVTSPRYGTKEISLITVEVNIFENLLLPYMTARLVIVDSANASNAVHFQGQERVNIIVLDRDANPLINKEFICMGIEYGQKLGDDKSGFVVKLIEEHAMLSNSTRFSKSYEGKPEDILQKVSTEQMGVSVDIGDSSIQKNMRVIFPFTVSPLEAINWMASRCTTGTGLPFCLYSTFVDNALQLKSFQTLFGQGATNAGDPFIFGTTNMKDGSTEEEYDIIAKKIMNYTINNNEDTLLAMIRNVYGGYYNFVDTFEYGGEEKIYDFTKPFDSVPKINGSGIYNYDPGFTIGRPYHKGQNTYSTQIVTRKLFEDGIYSYLEEDSKELHIRKAESRGLYNFIEQQSISATVPGIAFNFDKLGKQVEIYIRKDIPAEEGSTQGSLKDKKRSGIYLVQKVMYTIFQNRFTSTFTGTKMSTNGALGGEQLNQN